MQKLQGSLDHAPIHLAPGECRFRELPYNQGVEITLDGPSTCNYAAGLFYRSSPYVEMLFWHAPHPTPPCRGWERWKRRLLRWLCGGGDVLVHALRSHGNLHDCAQTVTIRVGPTRKVHRVALQPGQPLWFLHKSYVCSSSEVEIRAARCSLRRAAAARSLYVLEARLSGRCASGTLYLSGTTDIECITLQPGEGMRVNQGHVIGVSGELDYICEPVTTAHITERGFLQQFKERREKRKLHHAAILEHRQSLRWRIQHVWHHVQVLFQSVLTAEGLYVYSIRNDSGEPAQLYLQLDCPFVPESPGLLGLLIRYISYVTKVAKLPGMMGGPGIR